MTSSPFSRTGFPVRLWRTLPPKEDDISGSIHPRVYARGFLETAINSTKLELEQNKEEYLIFGSYPEVVEAKTFSEKAKILQETVSSYLFKGAAIKT